jgi:hypothetical protein
MRGGMDVRKRMGGGMSGEVWSEGYDIISQVIRSHVHLYTRSERASYLLPSSRHL